MALRQHVGAAAGLSPSPRPCPPAPGAAPGTAALGARAGFYSAQVQPGASGAPRRPCSAESPGLARGRRCSQRQEEPGPGQGEARAAPQPRGLVAGPAPQRRRAAPATGRHLPPAAADVRASPAPAGPRLPPSFPPSLPRNLHNAVGRAAGARLSGKGARPAGMRPGMGCSPPVQRRRASTLSCPHPVSQ